MAKQKHLGLCLLLLGAALAACSSEPKRTEQPELHVEFSPDAATFSPLSERFAAFTVSVSGFKNEADASSVELHLDEPEWLSWQMNGHDFSNGTKTFRINVSYEGFNHTEPSSAIQLKFDNLPNGYAYEAKTLLLAIANGKTKERAIPVTQANLQAFNRYANEPENLKLHYRLVEDVVLEAPVPPEASNWVAIGRYADNSLAEAFVGSFDGEGHTLSGLVIDSSESHQGLFGVLGENAVVENLGLAGSVKGGSWVGSLVGMSEGGTVLGSHAAVSVEGRDYVGGLVGEQRDGAVKNSHATGSVQGYNEIGGLVGYSNSSTVLDSHATGSVQGIGYVGGLVGYSYNGAVLSSHATGSVAGNSSVGGLVGINDSGTMQNTYATGNVEGTGGWVGGLVGENRGSVQNSYATGSVKGSENVGGLVGENSSDEFFKFSGSVQNSVALNPRVTQTADNADTIGRVVGNNTVGSTMKNNHARSDMEIFHGVENGNSGTPKTLSGGGDDSASVDGKSVSAGSEAGQYGNVSFWREGEVRWDFSTVWEWGPNNLPVLRVGNRPIPLWHDLFEQVSKPCPH